MNKIRMMIIELTVSVMIGLALNSLLLSFYRYEVSVRKNDDYYGLGVWKAEDGTVMVFSNNDIYRWVSIGTFRNEEFTVKRSTAYRIHKVSGMTKLEMDGELYYFLKMRDERVVLLHNGEQLRFSQEPDEHEIIEGAYDLNEKTYEFRGDYVFYEGSQSKLHYLGNRFLSVNSQIISDYTLYEYEIDQEGNLHLREINRDKGREFILKPKSKE